MANRASIKSFLLPYCEQIGAAIGTDDISELDHKRGQCSCSRPIEATSAVSTSEASLLAELENVFVLDKAPRWRNWLTRFNRTGLTQQR
jgi:hypothetical protein